MSTYLNRVRPVKCCQLDTRVLSSFRARYVESPPRNQVYMESPPRNQVYMEFANWAYTRLVFVCSPRSAMLTDSWGHCIVVIAAAFRQFKNKVQQEKNTFAGKIDADPLEIVGHDVSHSVEGVRKPTWKTVHEDRSFQIPRVRWQRGVGRR